MVWEAARSPQHFGMQSLARGQPYVSGGGRYWALVEPTVGVPLVLCSVGVQLDTCTGIGPLLKGRIDKGKAIPKRVGFVPSVEQRQVSIGILVPAKVLSSWWT